MPNRKQTRQAAYRARMLELGYVQKHVWIPADAEEKFEKYVERLRKAAE